MGFMDKFGTGEGWFSKIGQGGEGFMGNFGTGQGKLAQTFGGDFQGGGEDTPGANNLLDRSQEWLDRDSTYPGGEDEDEEGVVVDPTTDESDTLSKIKEANDKMTNTNKPFKNLFQKMKGGLGNIGSAEYDKEAFLNVGEVDSEGKSLETANPRFGKFKLDEEGKEMKGKGLFGKEGGFMSKFGTGEGAMSGLMGGLASGIGEGLSSMGGQGGSSGPGEYMYKSPWEGI